MSTATLYTAPNTLVRTAEGAIVGIGGDGAGKGAWAMGYTDATGTVVVEYCERTFESKSDAEEYLSHAPMGLWYWQGTIRGWQCPEGDYDSEAVGKFEPTTARLVSNAEAPGGEEP